MRIPPFERYPGLVRGAGILILGAIIGVAVYHSIYLSNYNTLVRLNGQLREQLEQTTKDIDKLNKFKNQHTVIKSIVPYIEEENGNPINELAQTELKKRLKEDLSVFIGQSIYKIDENASFARKLLKNKVYASVRGTDYIVSIRTMLVVDNVLQVWVHVEPYQRPPA
ncbi:conserved hypothetical protein [Paenibacillus curdlanolyticus YK9]|uniref:Sporulation membrane protein YtrI C-terminal domain-containing protein n=1 Tax=Paenibacillus curdlanolyticus YK9 TaxID=717606 RepID=E0IC13_9BACL|nr:hypothetical protein [Paenibacillus curdlanolyticus]EFM10243.1 conserved hypothetical protein [Paenibacillus curdlanolyticus YK9]